MANENLLCLAGGVRIGTIAAHCVAGLLSVFMLVFYAVNYRDCTINVGFGGGTRFQTMSKTAPGVIVMNVTALPLFVLMYMRIMKNEPAFFQSVQASIWTLLSHVYIMFLVPLINFILALVAFLEWYGFQSSVIGNNPGVSCSRLPADVQAYLSLLVSLAYGVLFFVDIGVFSYTIREVKY